MIETGDQSRRDVDLVCGVLFVVLKISVGMPGTLVSISEHQKGDKAEISTCGISSRRASCNQNQLLRESCVDFNFIAGAIVLLLQFWRMLQNCMQLLN